MKYITLILLLITTAAKAQVFKSPADAKVSAANIDSAVFIPAIGQVLWKITHSKDTLSDAWIVLKKTNGETITITDPWRFNVRQTGNKVAVGYPDSSKVIYVLKPNLNDTLITIPLSISKKTFDNAETIKLEIIR